MKRIISALLVCVIAVLSLTGCTQSSKEVLNIGGAEISSGTYTYFLNYAAHHPEKEGVSPQEQAIEMCKEYVAVNTLFRNNGYKLSSGTKKNVSVEANAQWRIFENYYENIGVNKQEFIAVSEYYAKRAELLRRYYGADGLYPVPENELKDYFSQHFVVFQSVSGYFTTTDENGNSVNLNEEQSNALRNQFKTMADRINGGAPMEEVSAEYLAAQSGSQQSDEEQDSLLAVVLEDNDTNYPEGFYAQIAAMKNNEVKVIELGQYIFLVKRADAFEGESSYFADSQDRCLEAMKSEDLKNIVSEEISKYEIKQKKSKLKSCLRKVNKQLKKYEKSEPSTAAETTAVETTAAQ